MKDPNFVLNVENEIKKKYGEKTIQNPKALWTQEKEKEYLQHLKELFHNEITKSQEVDVININGVSFDSKLFKEENNKVCLICKCYSFNRNDDIYLIKYMTCFKCFIERVEGREDKWIQKLEKINL